MRQRSKKKKRKTLAQKIQSQLRIERGCRQEQDRLKSEDQKRQEIRTRIRVHNKAESFFDRWKALFFGY